jgi:hypothetical protein
LLSKQKKKDKLVIEKCKRQTYIEIKDTDGNILATLKLRRYPTLEVTWKWE